MITEKAKSKNSRSWIILASILVFTACVSAWNRSVLDETKNNSNQPAASPAEIQRKIDEIRNLKPVTSQDLIDLKNGKPLKSER